jgi:signal recognition particle subunit SRP19
MDKGLILYPCYFDSTITRKEGRRTSLSFSVQNPVSDEIERVLKSSRILYQKEKKSHPSFWWKHENRFIITYEGSKQDLINLIGKSLKIVRAGK